MRDGLTYTGRTMRVMSGLSSHCRENLSVRNAVVAEGTLSEFLKMDRDLGNRADGAKELGTSHLGCAEFGCEKNERSVQYKQAFDLPRCGLCSQAAQRLFALRLAAALDFVLAVGGRLWKF